MKFKLPIRRWSCAALCGLLCLGVTPGAAVTDASATSDGTKSSSAHPASLKHDKHKHSAHSSTGKPSRGKTRGKRKRGQQAIDSPRARQIQEALIRQRYMEGEPSGKWDAATQDALRRYQSDQGWQSKTVPDSRALIKLGLGPSTDGLLNPESAMTAGPLASDGKAGTKQPTDPPANPTSAAAEENKPQR